MWDGPRNSSRPCSSAHERENLFEVLLLCSLLCCSMPLKAMSLYFIDTTIEVIIRRRGEKVSLLNKLVFLYGIIICFLFFLYYFCAATSNLLRCAHAKYDEKKYPLPFLLLVLLKYKICCYNINLFVC